MSSVGGVGIVLLGGDVCVLFVCVPVFWSEFGPRRFVLREYWRVLRLRVD